MKENYYLITGTSRGIGEAVAKGLLKAGNRLFCISRNQNPRLQLEADTKGVQIEDIAIDLSDLSRIKDEVREVFRNIRPEKVGTFFLINNAGTIHPIRTIGSGDDTKHIVRNLNVNLGAAMLITDLVLRETAAWEANVRVLNMSTGAAKRPVSGWAAYCSAKAGLDMFTRCVAEEQLGSTNPVRIVAIQPGVVNTEMQAEIRGSDPNQFKDLDRFVALKEEGRLLDPYEVAEKIIDVLHRPDFGAEIFMDVRELM